MGSWLFFIQKLLWQSNETSTIYLWMAHIVSYGLLMSNFLIPNFLMLIRCIEYSLKCFCSQVWCSYSDKVWRLLFNKVLGYITFSIFVRTCCLTSGYREQVKSYSSKYSWLLFIFFQKNLRAVQFQFASRQLATVCATSYIFFRTFYLLFFY